MIRALILVGLAVVVIGCQATRREETANGVRAWKGVLLAGDDRIRAFDNARETLAEMWLQRGIDRGNLVHLSRRQTVIASEGAIHASPAGLAAAFVALDVGPEDGCALFMTSHGSPTGLEIRGAGTLTPSELARVLNDACGERPTIALISGCYSGIFVDPLRGQNRIVLTAARSDRVSFGCTPDADYPHWDACVIGHFAQATRWQELHDRVSTCVAEREAVERRNRSHPQAFFGAGLTGARIFAR